MHRHTFMWSSWHSTIYCYSSSFISTALFLLFSGVLIPRPFSGYFLHLYFWYKLLELFAVIHTPLLPAIILASISYMASIIFPLIYYISVLSVWRPYSKKSIRSFYANLWYISDLFLSPFHLLKILYLVLSGTHPGPIPPPPTTIFISIIFYILVIFHSLYSHIYFHLHRTHYHIF